MEEVPSELRTALEVDETCDLDAIVAARRPEHHAALLDLLSVERSVPSEVRSKAVYAVGRWGDPAAVEPLLRLLPHLHEVDYARAVDALGRLGTDQALRAIEAESGNESVHVRKFAIRALGRAGTPRSLALLREIRSGDPAHHLRSLAADYLDRTEREDGTPAPG